MGKIYFTKKQKAEMRERRRKKKLYNEKKVPAHGEDAVEKIQDNLESSVPKSEENNGNVLDSPKATNKKRARVDTETTELTESKGTKKGPMDLTTKKVGRTLYVLIPSDVAEKNKKKFRKDARRQMRQSKQFKYNENDYDDVEFVTENEMPSIVRPQKKTKKQRDFPSIKDLLKHKQNAKAIQKEESKLQEKMNAIPEAVRDKYIALDCEMVGIGTDGKKSALARVSIVDWNLDVVLDTFVQVPIRVTDFRTHVSGVEPKHIKSKNAMAVKECRDKVTKILKGKILVGHALTNDFKALMTSHPKEMIRDTAKYRPFQRFGNGKWRARKLRDLVKENLKHKENFQTGEHDSVQDAMATMELFQTVFSQWEKEIESKTR